MFGMIEKMKQGILNDGFKPGTPTAPDTVAQPDALSDAEGVQQLAAIIERMKNHTAELYPSPLFGVMDNETWHTVTLRHCEHHLGFLEPKTHEQVG